MSERHTHAGFAATRWSLVQRARGGDATRGTALRELCLAYWPPLYAWLRRDGHEPDRALDLVQGFIARLLEKEDLGDVQGRFRSYLLGALQNFVRNAHRHERALQRGGDAIRLDGERAEQLMQSLPGESGTPQEAFERAFALEVLTRALNKLESEFAIRGDQNRFDVLRPLLDGAEAGAYERAAAALDSSTGALRVAVHRTRQRLGELIRAEVSETAGDPASAAEELSWLHGALRKPGESR